ncbi:M23 family peptidase, partial [Streptomyces sp. SID7499]|nr:M23 family peptidase [Streptomyces sp. SID7499]
MRLQPGPRRSPVHRTPLVLLSVFLLYVLLPAAPAPPDGSAVPTS